MLHSLWSSQTRDSIIKCLLFATATSLINNTTATAADKIYLTYGPLSRSITVNSLETFAREGRITNELSNYTRYFTSEQLDDLQDLLLTRAELNPVAVSQFLYSKQGETLLTRLGEVIQTEANQSGFYAIRASLILAAADSEGLTPLNIIDKFPLKTIRIDVESALKIISELESLINLTSLATSTIERQSAIEAASEPIINFNNLPDLRERGTGLFTKQTILLYDESRDRSFQTDLYLPQVASSLLATSSPPLIIISHGLGSDRSTFAYLAEHLASYGFAVAVPNHPGSDAAQLKALIEGRANEVTDPKEFINRPLDIKFLLSDLERRLKTEPRYQNRYDIENVGIVGQSLGGYTALVLAAGNIDFSQLEADCNPTSSINLSLLLQCRAQELSPLNQDLSEKRIKAIIAINPIGKSLLGVEGFEKINIPTMLVSGNADTIAPSLLEQIYPFTWISSSEKYFLLLRGATHFSTIGESTIESEAVQLPPEIVGPDPSVAREYINAMSTAFFSNYLKDEPNFQEQLGASYARFLSQTILPLRLIRRLSINQLTETNHIRERQRITIRL